MRFNLRTLAWVFLALTLGFAGGRLSVKKRLPEPSSASGKIEVAGKSPTLTTGKIEAPVSGSPATTVQEKVSVDSVLELQSLNKIAGQLTTSVQVQLFSRFDRLHPDAMAFLGLNPIQAAALDSALEQARAKLDALTERSAQLNVSGETISIRVPALDGGPAIYDSLMDDFTNVVGREKTTALITLLGDQFSTSFSQFGAEERTITIARTLPGYDRLNDDGYYLREVRTTANDRPVTNSWRFWGGRTEYLPSRIQWATRLAADRLEKTYPAKAPE